MDFSDVPVQRQAVGGDVVQEVEFAVRSGLDDPDGHEVRHPDVPRGIDGQEGVHLKLRREAAQFPEAVDLTPENGACRDGIERFIRNRGVFLAHEPALGTGHGFIPGFLFIIENDVVILFQGLEVFLHFPVAGGLAAFQPVFMLTNPGKEEESEVQRGEGLAHHVHGGHRERVVEAVLASFVGGFLDDDAGFGDGVEAAGHDFRGLFGIVGGNGSQFRDMENLKGAAAQGGGGIDSGAVREFDIGLGEGRPFHLVLDQGADQGDEAVPFRGVFRKVVQVVESEVHLVHLLFRLRASAVDDAAGDVGGEEGGVQLQDGGKGGDAELAHFQDVVAVVELVVEFFLRPIHTETLEQPLLINDPVEVVETPLAVIEQRLDFLVLFRSQFHERGGEGHQPWRARRRKGRSPRTRRPTTVS